MMLHRMFHRDLCSDYMRSLGEERNHHMLITASPVLCSAIRAKYESTLGILRTNRNGTRNHRIRGNSSSHLNFLIAKNRP